MYGINKETVGLFAFSNDGLIQGKIKAIVLEFHGLGNMTTSDEIAKMFADKGILYIMPYDNPWSWMNDVAVKTVDQILDVYFEKYHLDSSIKIVSTGGSMGGLSAFMFTKNSKHRVTACAVFCPVCDLYYHYTERLDLPKTIYSAFAHYDCDIETAIKSNSSVHQVANLPNIDYYILHGDSDRSVALEKHSAPLVEKLRANGYSVIFDIIPGMDHGCPKGEARERYYNFIFDHTK